MHSALGSLRAERSRSQPRMPVPMETKRILLSLGAARTAGSSRIDLAAVPAATVPAPRRTKSLREIGPMSKEPFWCDGNSRLPDGVVSTNTRVGRR